MTKDRAELLSLIAQLSEAVPEQRLGQLVANLATVARGAIEGALWDCEDEEFLPAARRMLEQYRGRQSDVA